MRSSLPLIVLILAALVPPGTHAAGWCAGIERGESCGAEHANPEAQALHLLDGEQPRGRDSLWGAGLIETVIETDVFVAGGGSAGTSAALAAARSGASTVLVNARPVLGGNSGSEVRLSMVGACGPRSGAGNVNALKMECREGGIVEEYQLDNTVNNPNLVPELFSLELLTLMKAEPKLTLFQNTYFVGVTMDNATSGTGTDTGTGTGGASGVSGLPRITSAIVENQDSQRRYIIKAKTYIDATGDGRLGAEAGAEWIQGREGKEQYNESLAGISSQKPQLGPDHETEGSSLDFEAGDRGVPTTFRPPFWAAKYNKSQFRYRGVSGTRPYGYWWNEISWPYNTITDGENVTQEALSDLLGIWDYIKNGGDHADSERMGLTWLGNVACKREGRRFVGQYVVSQNDVMADEHANPPQEPELFWDRVAYSGWPFDLHNPKGMRDPSHPPFTSHKTPYMFSTPLRSLVAKDVSNLFFAGRLASFSHVVYGSERVMKTCATMGQAVGTAAAYAVSQNIAPANLKDSNTSVWSIQQQLLRDDAFIIGSLNEDPRDHARRATVSASSTLNPDGSATNVISGQSRAVVHETGVPASQGKSGSNRWISQGLPAAISLKLDAPTAVAQAHLVFDTGMHRKLSYSVVFKTNNPVSTWGPQPETVRDYIIEGRNAATGAWETLCNVTGNYQRRRVHSLPCPADPSPTPPPKPAPVVAPGSVVATLCNVSSSLQNWTVNDDQSITVRGDDGTLLCLGYDDTISAYGGHGQAVVARPCKPSSSTSSSSSSAPPQKWTYSRTTPGGATIGLASGGVPCVAYKGQCQCIHAVACAACHTGGEAYAPPTSVELWTCARSNTHIEWSSLSAGGAGGGGLLMSDGGLCLEAPRPNTTTIIGGGGSSRESNAVLSTTATANQASASQGTPEMENQSPRPPARQRVVRRRVAGKERGDGGEGRRENEVLPPPTVTEIRVTVTATNGIPNAHVNEIRLYDAAGVAPFPRPAQ